MADIILDETGQLPLNTQLRYKDMGDGTHALVRYAETSLVVNLPPGEDGQPQPPLALLVDPIHDALVTVPNEVYETHVGHVWRASYLVPHDAQIADDGVLNVVITTGAKEMHVSWHVGTGGNCEVYLYRAPTVVANTGTTLQVANLLDSVTASPVSTLRQGQTVNALGTLILNEFLPGGSGPKAVGAVGRESAHMVLRTNTIYLASVTNVSGGAAQFSYTFRWGEEDPL